MPEEICIFHKRVWTIFDWTNKRHLVEIIGLNIVQIIIIYNLCLFSLFKIHIVSTTRAISFKFVFQTCWAINFMALWTLFGIIFDYANANSTSILINQFKIGMNSIFWFNVALILRNTTTLPIMFDFIISVPIIHFFSIIFNQCSQKLTMIHYIKWITFEVHFYF